MTAGRMSPPQSVDFLHIGDTEGPRAANRALVQSGVLAADPCQALAVEKLQGLSRALLHYKPGNGEGGWRARLGLVQTDPAPQGLYRFGPVGRGKSMLMDLFFAATPIAKKRRVRMYSFMLEWRARIFDDGKLVDGDSI